jgi:hypothetical protein
VIVDVKRAAFPFEQQLAILQAPIEIRAVCSATLATVFDCQGLSRQTS